MCQHFSPHAITINRDKLSSFKNNTKESLKWSILLYFYNFAVKELVTKTDYIQTSLMTTDTFLQKWREAQMTL